MTEKQTEDDKPMNLFGSEIYGEKSEEIEKEMEVYDAESFKQLKRKVTKINLLVLGLLVIFFTLPIFIDPLRELLFTGWVEKYNVTGCIFGVPLVYLMGYNSFYFTAKAKYEKKFGIEENLEQRERVRVIANRIFYFLLVANSVFFYYQIKVLFFQMAPETRFINFSGLTISFAAFAFIIIFIIATSFKVKK